MNDVLTVIELLAMLVTHPRTGVLIALLAAAAVIDWRTYRIPNWLTVGGMVYGLACNAVLAPDALSGGLDAFAGLLLGLFLLLPMYLLRVMGAGDVKLMAMVGAFVGLGGIVYAVLFTLAAGGVAALAFAMKRRAARRLATNVHEIVMGSAFAMLSGMRPAGMAPGASIGRFPYGVAVSAGTLVWLVARHLGAL